MTGFTFSGYALLLALALFVPIWLLSFRKNPGVSMPFPRVANLRGFKTSWRVRFSFLPRMLLWMSLLLFLFAFIDPRIVDSEAKKRMKEELKKAEPPPSKGLAIYFILDQSGSMATKVIDETGDQIAFVSKLDLLKSVTRDFVRGNRKLGLVGRKNDLVGIVTFARVPEVLSPLTLDHQGALNQLNKIDVVKTRMRDGTAMGYAIYKTAAIIGAMRQFGKEEKSGYTIQDAVMILVTDGFQFPHADDKGNRLRTMGVEEAARFAKEQDIRLYIVSIDPSIKNGNYAPQRALLRRSAELTGGRFYPESDPKKLASIYQQINTLEKSTLPIERPKRFDVQIPEIRKSSYYTNLIGLGLFALGLAVFLDCTLFRRIP